MNIVERKAKSAKLKTKINNSKLKIKVCGENRREGRMQYAPTNQKRKKGIMYCNCGRGTMHRAHRKRKTIK